MVPSARIIGLFLAGPTKPLGKASTGPQVCPRSLLLITLALQSSGSAPSCIARVRDDDGALPSSANQSRGGPRAEGRQSPKIANHLIKQKSLVAARHVEEHGVPVEGLWRDSDGSGSAELNGLPIGSISIRQT